MRRLRLSFCAAVLAAALIPALPSAPALAMQGPFNCGPDEQGQTNCTDAKYALQAAAKACPGGVQNVARFDKATTDAHYGQVVNGQPTYVRYYIIASAGPDFTSYSFSNVGNYYCASEVYAAGWRNTHGGNPPPALPPAQPSYRYPDSFNANVTAAGAKAICSAINDAPIWVLGQRSQDHYDIAHQRYFFYLKEGEPHYGDRAYDPSRGSNLQLGWTTGNHFDCYSKVAASGYLPQDDAAYQKLVSNNAAAGRAKVGVAIPGGTISRLISLTSGLSGILAVSSSGLAWLLPAVIPSMTKNPDGSVMLSYSGNGQTATFTLAKIISTDGSSIISRDGAGLIAQDGSSLLAVARGSIISNDGGSLIGNAGGTFSAPPGASIALAPGSTVNIITHDGGSLRDAISTLVTDGGSQLLAKQLAASLQSQGTSQLAVQLAMNPSSLFNSATDLRGQGLNLIGNYGNLSTGAADVSHAAFSSAAVAAERPYCDGSTNVVFAVPAMKIYTQASHSFKDARGNAIAGVYMCRSAASALGYQAK